MAKLQRETESLATRRLESQRYVVTPDIPVGECRGFRASCQMAPSSADSS